MLKKDDNDNDDDESDSYSYLDSHILQFLYGGDLTDTIVEWTDSG